MKRIGITQRLDRIPEYGEVRTALDIKWVELLESLDFFAIPLPININKNLIHDLDLSGFILTGGNNLSSQSNDELSILRDRYEYQCIQYAIENSLPVFGACHGMQIIAAYFGSTFCSVENHVSIRHKIKIVDKTNLGSMLTNIDDVNSYHNFAINKLGNDLQTVAICPSDNTIEAIKHRDYMIFGQMWHPEREDPFNKYNCHLIQKIIDD